MLNLRLLTYLLPIILLSACNRHVTTPAGNNGYNYTPTKPTDPFVYNTKPLDTVPVVITSPPDTVIIVVEQPRVDTVVINNTNTITTTIDPFAQPEPWMRPTQGSYLVAKIKRTGCYGTCPIYVGAIFSDGKAFYYGERFVEKLGYFEGNVNLVQLNSLVKLSYQNSFYDLAPIYPTDGRYIVDLPTSTIHFNSGINQKTITNKGNAPEELSLLQESLHTLLNSITWMPIKY